MSLKGLLPRPVHVAFEDDTDDDIALPKSTAVVSASKSKAPPYGHRHGWVPRGQQDFGDGGAFPEIHVAQFPLGMGRSDTKAGNGSVVPVQVDASGKVQYDALLRQSSDKDKIIHSTYNALVAVDIEKDDPKRELPDEEAIQETAEKTKAALDKIVGNAVSNTRTTHIEKQNRNAQYIHYTPANPLEGAGPKQRVIRMVEVQNDPMEPPKFKVTKKIPKGPGSPPAPVLHSPPRKVTPAEQRDWTIPPCISNWKNHKGYTVPLDKRMAADGRSLQDVTINDKFAKFSEALYIAERKSREAIELRSDIERRAAQKDKERKEETLRNLAARAREERAGIKNVDEEEMDEVMERDQIRSERMKERRREMNIRNAAPDKRSRLERDKERDVTERVALGLPAVQRGGDTAYDTRLYGQSRGMDSGFGHEDQYNVYDKPFRGQQAASIYRPSAKKDEFGDEEYERIKSTDRFQADKGFAGTEGGSGRAAGPVQFEKKDDDLFGLDAFLSDAKESSKRKAGLDDRDPKRRR